MQKKLQATDWLKLLVIGALLCPLGYFAQEIYFKVRLIEFDKVAEGDYQRLRAAVTSAVAAPNGPTRMVFSGQEGPFLYPKPLRGMELSSKVQATIFFESKTGPNQKPTTLTRLVVFHPEGSAKFVMSDVNGVVNEQVLKRSDG